MDSLATSAAHLLARGDPLGALKRVALREDPAALALRGIAMAQLGDYERARQLLRRAAREFGDREPVAQARCRVAEAEVALAARDLTWPESVLAAAGETLEAHRDRINALQARLIAARRHLLIGETQAAGDMLANAMINGSVLPPALRARVELTQAELALRRLQISSAGAALDRADEAARSAGVPALLSEIERARRALFAPAARRRDGGLERVLRLDEIERLFASDSLIVDGCRRTVRGGELAIQLHRRPVLFELARALAEAWPEDVPRHQLITRTFGARVPNESHRSRLRVEIGRLRTLLRPLARITSTSRGFVLSPLRASSVAVLAPPTDGPAGAILALLEDGQSWSTSALACALGSSQRSVQRTLRDLEESAAVRSMGSGRSRRWLAPALGGFTTALLLPGALALG